MAYVYSGFAFPLQVGEGGIPQMQTDVELIGSSIMQVLLTQKGERVMRGELGTNLLRLVFESADPFIDRQIVKEVRSAIARFEPRAVVHDVRVIRKDNFCDVDIEYSFAGQTGTVKVPLGEQT